MRITGGKSRGRLLASLKGLGIRPTTDQVREAIFNLIGQDLNGQRALDLFAGTGSLGIEALSRGASWALFVDNSEQAIKLIRKNLILCEYETLGSILKKDLKRGLPRNHGLMKEPFDLVFVDPPYGKGLIPPLLLDLVEDGILASTSRVVAESSKLEILPDALRRLRLFNARTYGDTKISIYDYGDRK